MAREYQVYSLFQEMMPALKQLHDGEKEKLKTIAFHNTMLKAIKDQRKFIRDIRGLIKNNTYAPYFEEQDRLGREIAERFSGVEVRTKEDIDRFAMENAQITEQLQASMERALLRSRAQQLKSKPSENVSKSIALMMDVDPRLFGRMDHEEKETLKAELQELERLISSFRSFLEK